MFHSGASTRDGGEENQISFSEIGTKGRVKISPGLMQNPLDVTIICVSLARFEPPVGIKNVATISN